MTEKNHDFGLLVCIYLQLLPRIRETAKTLGYALAIHHGTMARDLDILAAPWTEDAADPSKLVAAIVDAVGGFVIGDLGATPGTVSEKPTLNPHGRLSWNICWGGKAFIDLSVMPKLDTTDDDEPRARLAEVSVTNEEMRLFIANARDVAISTGIDQNVHVAWLNMALDKLVVATERADHVASMKPDDVKASLARAHDVFIDPEHRGILDKRGSVSAGFLAGWRAAMNIYATPLSEKCDAAEQRAERAERLKEAYCEYYETRFRVLPHPKSMSRKKYDELVWQWNIDVAKAGILLELAGGPKYTGAAPAHDKAARAALRAEGVSDV